MTALIETSNDENYYQNNFVNPMNLFAQIHKKDSQNFSKPEISMKNKENCISAHSTRISTNFEAPITFQTPAVRKEEKMDFLKPIAVKMNYKEGSKTFQVEMKKKFHQDYKDSLRGINNQFDMDFLVDNCVGSGSTGATFKAQSTRQRGKHYALKFVMEKKANNITTHHKRAKNEIKIQYNLKSQYITQIFGYYTLNNDYCIVQDYEHLGDLNNFQTNILNGGHFNENLIMMMGNNIIKAMKHLYEMNIAHFDIKKENILVDEFFNFKLSDFSVAESYYGYKEAYLRNIGTGCYISPENYRKEKISTGDLIKVDLWSLGILMYKLANKERFPFNLSGKEQNLEEIQLKICNNHLNIEELNTSEELKDLLFKLLKKNIRERISLKDVLDHPWFKMSEELLDIKHKYGDNVKFILDVMNNKVF